MSRPVVTIAGAGPVGSLLALLLARQGRAVRLLERRHDPRRDPGERGRSINLALAARGIGPLRAAGVLARVQPQLVEMRGRALHEPGGGERFLPYGQHAGEVIHAVERSRLNNVLLDAVEAQPGVTLLFGARCLGADVDARRLRWRDQASGQVREERYDVLLATDGAGSALRGSLVAAGHASASEEPLAHDYREFVIPPQAGGKYALEPHALHIWPRGDFMLIALPNPDGSFTATLFLAREPLPGAAADAPCFARLADAAAARALFQAQFPDALALVPDFEAQWQAHPQSRLATLRCWPWHQRELLLVGDAAHAIVPFHGQGMNCGFEDCAVLADMLAALPVDADGAAIAATFPAFERTRRPDTDAIAAMAIENYEEMRARVLAPDFARRKELAAGLERAFPGRFIPRYSMVMFHAEIPYAEALRRGALQESLLDALLARGVPPAADGETAGEGGSVAAPPAPGDLAALAASPLAAQLLADAGL
jgi:kynurenine 3-monooxygenase